MLWDSGLVVLLRTACYFCCHYGNVVEGGGALHLTTAASLQNLTYNCCVLTVRGSQFLNQAAVPKIEFILIRSVIAVRSGSRFPAALWAPHSDVVRGICTPISRST